MKKIVINNCFGGFGLSPKAVKRIAELQGKECYFFEWVIKEDIYKPISLEEAEKRMMFFSAFSVPNPKEVLPKKKKGKMKHTRTIMKHMKKLICQVDLKIEKINFLFKLLRN